MRFAIAIILFAAGCEGSGISKAYERTTAGQCPSPAQHLVGTKAEGATCADFTECAPTCCSCEGGGNRWLATSCREGKCGTAAQACTDTRDDDRFCR